MTKMTKQEILYEEERWYKEAEGLCDIEMEVEKLSAEWIDPNYENEMSEDEVDEFRSAMIDAVREMIKHDQLERWIPEEDIEPLFQEIAEKIVI